MTQVCFSVAGEPLDVRRPERMLTGNTRGRRCRGFRNCGRILQQRENFLFDGQLMGIRELESVAGKNFDSVICPRIMRGGNYDAGIEAARASQIGYARRGYDAGAVRLDSGGSQPQSDAICDPTAGITRVLTNDDSSLG